MKGKQNSMGDIRLSLQATRIASLTFSLWIIMLACVAPIATVLDLPWLVMVPTLMFISLILSTLLVWFRLLPWFNDEDQNLTLIRTLPNFSIYMEEVLKSIPGGAHVIGSLEFLKYGSWKNYNWHVRSLKYDICERIRRHRAFNDSRRLRLKQLYDATANSPNIPLYPHGVEVLYNTELRPTTLPKLPKGSGPRNYGTQDFQKNRKDFRMYGGAHAFLFGITSMRKLAPSEDNLEGCLDIRVLGYENAMCSEEIVKEMEEIELIPLPVFELDKNKWRNNLRPIQKTRNERFRADRLDGKVVGPIEMNMKANELLSTGHLIPRNDDKVVGRPIFSITGKYLDYQGCFVTEASKFLASVYGPDAANPIQHKGRLIYAYFTCGATAQSLNKFYNTALAAKTGIYIMVMGDDVLAVDNYSEEFRFLESDFSRFDRSQTYLLQSVYPNYLRTSGYTLQARSVEEMVRDRITVKHKRGRNKLPSKERAVIEMQLSGGPPTCLQNSIINIKITALAVVSKNPIATYKEAGLTAKLKRDMDPRKSFLRGVFLLTTRGYVWMRLPSFLCKFGKMMSNPLHIYRKVPRGTCYRMALLSQWKGYGDLCVNWFYTQIHEQILRICGDVRVEATDLESWQIFSNESVYVEDAEFNNFMYQRYAVTVPIMEHYITTLRSISELPVVYVDPFLQMLVDVDY
jgi:hypothetical protein